MRFQNILTSMMASLLLQRNLAPSFMTRAPVRGVAKRRNKTTKHGLNGKREVARRLRQIGAGQLTSSNGLVSREELYGRQAA